jgi:hypothetical protein
VVFKLRERRYGGGDGGMVAEHGGRAGDVMWQQWRRCLARWWFSAGGDAIEVRILIF